MFSLPSEYQRMIVRPAVDRFLSNPTAYELCFSACIFLFHFCDVYAAHHGGGIKAEDVWKRIEREDPQINIVHAVCIAAKHVVVSNRKLGNLVGLKAEHAVIGKSAAFSDGSYFSDGASFAEHPEVVCVQTPDGTWHDLTFAVSSVADTIETKFV